MQQNYFHILFGQAYKQRKKTVGRGNSGPKNNGDYGVENIGVVRVQTRLKEGDQIKKTEDREEGKINSGQLMINDASRIMFFSGLRSLLSLFNTPSDTEAANGLNICIPT